MANMVTTATIHYASAFWTTFFARFRRLRVSFFRGWRNYCTIQVFFRIFARRSARFRRTAVFTIRSLFTRDSSTVGFSQRMKWLFFEFSMSSSKLPQKVFNDSVRKRRFDESARDDLLNSFPRCHELFFSTIQTTAFPRFGENNISICPIFARLVQNLRKRAPTFRADVFFQKKRAEKLFGVNMNDIFSSHEIIAEE